MKSIFKLPYDISGEQSAFNIENINLVENEHLKVYIPSLMCNIPKGSATTFITTTYNKPRFLNQGNTPPLTNPVLKEQNYMTCELLRAPLDIKKAHYSSINISEDSHVRTEFLSGKIDKLLADVSTTDTNIKYNE